MKNIHSFKHYFALLLFVLCILLIYQPSAFLFNNLEIGKISNKDIIAPKSVTYIDEEATDEAKEQALEEIDSVYDKDMEIYEDFSEKLDIFKVSMENYYDDQEDDSKKSKEKMSVSDIKNPFNIKKDEMKQISKVNSSDFFNFINYIKNEVWLIYDSGLNEENLESTKELLLTDSSLYLFPNILKEEVYVKILDELEPNLMKNREESSKRIDEALEQVDPVYKKVSKGEAILREHEEVTESHIQKLSELGMIENKFNFENFLSFLPTVILVSLLYHLYCGKFLLKRMSSLRVYAITLFSIVLSVGATQFLQNTDWFMIPTLTVLIIFAVFFPRNFLIVTAIIIGLFVNYGDIVMLMITLVSGISLMIFYNKFKTFTDAIKSGLMLGIIIALSSIIFYYTFEQRLEYLNIFPFIISGIAAGVIANGIIPLIEKATGITTVYKLSEINKLDHPILEEMYARAKGTYDHSRNVAHLATAASQKLETNTLLLRVAALFHDIGKIDNPEYFIENSSPEDNIHDRIPPMDGAEVILNHPWESVRLCKQNKIPDDVIEIIEKHHGDSVLKHFYYRSKKEGYDYTEKDFQYTTPPPVTKEESILLLADATEAYSRVLDVDSYEELKEKVDEMFDKKIKDGVLRKSELTMREINIISEEFCKALTASNHKRVQYKTSDTGDKKEG